MGLSPTMTAKDKLQCLFRVFVECGGRSTWEAGRFKVGANTGPVIICSLSRWEIVRRLINTANVFHVRHSLGGLD